MTRYVVAAAVLAFAGIAAYARQQPAAEGQAKADPAANHALARKQLALIDQALEVQHALARNGRLPLNDPSFAVWGRRKLETLRRVGAGKAEVIAALEKCIETLKADEALAVRMKEEARGTEAAVLDVRYRLIEAEIWMNEEKAR